MQGFQSFQCTGMPLVYNYGYIRGYILASISLELSVNKNWILCYFPYLAEFYFYLSLTDISY